MADLIINSYFSRAGVPELGLSPIIRIWQVDETTDTLIITNDTMNEIGDGFYKYIFTSINGYLETERYIIRSDSNDNTMSDQERYSVGLTDESALSQTTIDSIVDATWDESSVDHLSTGTTGLLLNTIAADTSQLLSDNILEISILELLLKYERNKTSIDKVAMTLTIWDDDGLTPLTIFDLKDSTGAASVTEICIRDPQ